MKSDKDGTLNGGFGGQILHPEQKKTEWSELEGSRFVLENVSFQQA